MKRLRVIRELERCLAYCVRELDDEDVDCNDAEYHIGWYKGQIDAFDKSLEVVEDAMKLLRAIALCALGAFIILMGYALWTLSVVV